MKDQRGPSFIRKPSNSRGDPNGEQVQLAADRAAKLAWSKSQESLEITSVSDVTVLSSLHRAVLRLKTEFFASTEPVVIAGERRQQLDKRLMMLEHDIDGLMRRKISLTLKEGDRGRVLDYTNMLADKENQIVGLESKIKNYEQRLKKSKLKEKQLAQEISSLKRKFSDLSLPSLAGREIDKLLLVEKERDRYQQGIIMLKRRMDIFAGVISVHFDKMKEQGVTVDNQEFIQQILQSDGMQIEVVNGLLKVVSEREKVIEVPVQDARTKQLIHSLAIQVRTFVERYPKLRTECDARLLQFVQQEIVDLMDSDAFERVVSIVKYVPDFQRVQNVYAYDSAKSRKVERQLRMLVRHLVDELQKMKHRTGSVLEIDEGMMQLIRAEILQLGDVGDVLTAFRAVPRIVQVEKIVEKVVERIIEVPQMVPIERVVQKIVEVVRVQEVEKIVHVPVKVVEYVELVVEKVVEVPSYTERVIEVPRIVQKIVERIVEVPKIVEVQVFVDRVLEVVKPQIIEKIVYERVVEYQEVEVVREKIVPRDRIIQRVVQVPVIRQRIVERVVEVIKPFDRVVEKIVEVVKYRNAREIVNHVVDLPQPVEVIVEKLVPVIQTVERIVEVPTMVQKIVEVVRTVDRINQVKVFEQKIVYVDRIKEVERVVNIPVTVIHEVEKIVERRIEVPMIQQKIVRVPEIVTNIVVQRVEIPRIVEVVKTVEKIVEVSKVVEVEKLVNVIIRKNVPVNVVVQKLVEVVRTVERIKEVRVQVEKIIEKMVEVPKVIEVERIVEKIVVVPRVIEKIVEVPQIVERVVDRIVEVERIREVQTIVQIPMFEERDVEVQVVRNIYTPSADRVVERVVETIVPVQRVIENTKYIDHFVEKIVEIRVQVPKEVMVDRIVPLVRQVEKVIEIDRPTVVLVEVPVPVDRMIQKLVVLEREVEKVVQVTQQVEKVVQVRCEQVRIQQIVKIVEKPIQREVVREITKEVPYISENIREVKVNVMVAVPQAVTIIKEVPTIFEKVVSVTKEIVRIEECERLMEIIVSVPQIVELPIEVPYIVRVNQVIEVFRDRVVEVPLIHQQIKQVTTFEERVVVVQNKTTQVREVVVYREKVEKRAKDQELIVKTDTRNHIQTSLKVVEKVQERLVPIYSTIEKIVEVPLLLEKIVEKVVIMPQVVEVVKYVHELVQDNPLHMLADADLEEQEIKYKELYGQVRSHFGAVLLALRKLRAQNAGLQIEIDILQNFLTELDKIMQFPRFYPVQREVVVEKEVSRPMFLPTKDPTSLRNELAMALLVEKLVAQLRSIKRISPKIRFQLDEDIQLIFFSEFFGCAELNDDLNKKLHSYRESVQSKISAMGSWTTDHDLMVNSILQQRFAMADMIRYANVQIEKSKMIADERLQVYKQLKQKNMLVETKLGHFQSEFMIVANNASGDSTVTKELKRLAAALTEIKDVFHIDARTIPVEVPSMVLGEINGTEEGFFRLQSAFRTIERENEMLREKYLNLEKEVPNSHALTDKERVIENLTKQIVDLTEEISRLKSQASVNINVNTNSEEFQIRMRTLNSRIQELESQMRAQKIDSQSQIRRKELAIKDLQEKVAGIIKEKEVLAEANKALEEQKKAKAEKQFVPMPTLPKGKSYQRINGEEREILRNPRDPTDPRDSRDSTTTTMVSLPKTQSPQAVLPSIPQQLSPSPEVTPGPFSFKDSTQPRSSINGLTSPPQPLSLSLQDDDITPGNPYSTIKSTVQPQIKDRDTIPPGIASRLIRPSPISGQASMSDTPDPPPREAPHPYSFYDQYGQPTAPRLNGMLSARHHSNQMMRSPNFRGEYRN